MGESYLSSAMIPLMMTLVLGYYAARLLIFHDTESITGKNGAKFKDKEKYVTESGKLILFMAAGSFIMAIIMYFNAYVAETQIAVWFLIFGILWKRMNDKYGDTKSHKKK